jgi:hypothetical protein
VSTPSSADASTAVIVLLFIVLILARRTYLMVQGTRYSTGRLVAFGAFYVLLFVALAFTTLYAAVGTWGPDGVLLLAPYVAVPVLAAVLVVPYVRRIVRFERRDDGQWYYRLPGLIPVLYLTLFVFRILAEFAVFGIAGLAFSFPLPAPPSVGALEILIGVDLLFGFSLGLLVGRGIGVYRAHRDLPAEPASPAHAPLPEG